MHIKQVITVIRSARGSQRVVFGSDGSVIAGDQEAALALKDEGATIAVTVRGTIGGTITAVIDGDGKQISGDADALSEILEDFAHDPVDTFLEAETQVEVEIEVASDTDSEDDGDEETPETRATTTAPYPPSGSTWTADTGNN